MSVLAVDEPQAILDLLSAGWLSANTDSKTPTFERIIDLKKIPLNTFAYYDYVLAYQGQRVVTAQGLGGYDQEVVRVSLDIRSDGNGQTDGRAHAIKVRDEVVRIIRANYGTRISSKYDILQYVDERDLSDKLKKLFRHVIEVELTALAISPS